ncbi:hypothetical protein FQN57_001798 [Myotisia sp. PD_48]|nr:hypothetical protein FQN57_001798 [Myotisia sp. PD_48]
MAIVSGGNALTGRRRSLKTVYLTSGILEATRKLQLEKEVIWTPKHWNICCSSTPPELECVKGLCKELRKILFPIHKDALFTGTPAKPEILYDPIIQAFDKAIKDIMAAKAPHITT